MAERTNHVLQCHLSAWDQIVELAGKLGASGVWLFRGQEDAKWPLETRIIREARTYDVPLPMLRRCEVHMLRELKRIGHHYLPSPPGMNQDLEWLELIQHHSGATRLLDFTWSLYVACFFALENARGAAALWALNRFDIEGSRDMSGAGGGYGTDASGHGPSAREIVEEIIRKGTDDPKVYIVTPFRLNDRMVAQQAVSLFPGSLERSFDQCLSYSFGGQHVNTHGEAQVVDFSDLIGRLGGRAHLAVKLVIPHALQLDMMKQLTMMKITAATLFPDLDGFMRSLLYDIRAGEKYL